jgi:transcriptional regulator with XRE-family HTH domain
MDKLILGIHLKKWRKKEKKEQKEVGAAIGQSQAVISRLETGVAMVTIKQFILIKRYLNVSEIAMLKCIEAVDFHLYEPFNE